MKNITLENFRITVRDWSKVTSKKVAELQLMDAIDRGLYRMKDHSDLRHDLTSVYRSLQKQADQITDEFRKELKDLVDRFNKCETQTVNQKMLNDRTITKEGFDEESGEKPDLDKPDATRTNSTKVDEPKSDDKDDKSKPSDDDKTKQASGASLDDIAGLLDQRLNPVVAVLPKDKDGKYVPVASKEDLKGFASKNDLEALENRAKAYIDSNAGGSSYNYRVAGIAAAITFVIVFIVFLVPAGLTIINALLFAVIAATILGLIAGAIATKRNSNK